MNEWLDLGMGIDDVKALVGHKNINTTMQYIIKDPTKIKIKLNKKEEEALKAEKMKEWSPNKDSKAKKCLKRKINNLAISSKSNKRVKK